MRDNVLSSLGHKHRKYCRNVAEMLSLATAGQYALFHSLLRNKRSTKYDDDGDDDDDEYNDKDDGNLCPSFA